VSCDYQVRLQDGSLLTGNFFWLTAKGNRLGFMSHISHAAEYLARGELGGFFRTFQEPGRYESGGDFYPIAQLKALVPKPPRAREPEEVDRDDYVTCSCGTVPRCVCAGD
jgi:hypothetical protein